MLGSWTWETAWALHWSKGPNIYRVYRWVFIGGLGMLIFGSLILNIHRLKCCQKDFQKKTPAGITLNDYQASYKYYMVEFGKNDIYIALTLCYILLLCTVSPLAVLEFSRAEWSGGDVSRTLTLLERIINVRVKSVW